MAQLLARRTRTLSLLTGWLAVAATTAWGATYEVDPAHSTVGFSIRHLISRVQGVFNRFEGTIDFDPKAPDKLRVKASIDVASVNTRNDRRDEHLRSPEFFDAKKYPKMTFQSTKVEKLGANKFRVTGKLTLHGVTKPVTLEVVYGGQVKDPWGNTRIGFHATGKLNRKDFGISWNKVLDQGTNMIGDEVTINIDVEAILKKK